MGSQSFTMHPTKNRRIRYVILVFAPPILLMQLFQLIIRFFPPLQHDFINQLAIYTPLAIMVILGYFFIWKKNHILEIKDHAITEKNIQGKVITKIKAKQIYTLRRNFLDEFLLQDKSGNILLCVEPNMENRTLFENWLEKHNIDYH